MYERYNAASSMINLPNNQPENQFRSQFVSENTKVVSSNSPKTKVRNCKEYIGLPKERNLFDNSHSEWLEDTFRVSLSNRKIRPAARDCTGKVLETGILEANSH